MASTSLFTMPDYDNQGSNQEDEEQSTDDGPKDDHYGIVLFDEAGDRGFRATSLVTDAL